MQIKAFILAFVSYAALASCLFACNRAATAGEQNDLESTANAVAATCMKGADALTFQEWVLLANQSLELLDLGNPVRQEDDSLHFYRPVPNEGYSFSLVRSRDAELNLDRFELEYDLEPQGALQKLARNLKLTIVAYLDGNRMHSFHVLANHEVHNSAALGEFLQGEHSTVLRSGGSYKMYPDSTIWHSVEVHLTGASQELPIMSVGIGELESRPAVSFNFIQMELLESTLCALR